MEAPQTEKKQNFKNLLLDLLETAKLTGQANTLSDFISVVESELGLESQYYIGLLRDIFYSNSTPTEATASL